MVDGDVLSALLRGWSGVLRGQLQLRRGRAVLVDDVSTTRGARRAWCGMAGAAQCSARAATWITVRDPRHCPSADGDARVVSVPLVCAGRARDNRGGVGGPGRREIRTVIRQGNSAQFVRPDPQPQHVSSVGRECGADIARHLQSRIHAIPGAALQRRTLLTLELLVQRAGSDATGDLPEGFFYRAG